MNPVQDLDFINCITSGPRVLVSKPEGSLVGDLRAVPCFNKLGHNLNVANCISLILLTVFLLFRQLYFSDSANCISLIPPIVFLHSADCISLILNVRYSWLPSRMVGDLPGVPRLE